MQNNEIQIEKKIARSQARASLRKYIDADIENRMQRQFEYDVSAKLCQKDCFVQSTILLGYYPMKYEASCLEILHRALALGKKIALPKVYTNDMTFHFCENLCTTNFKLNSYGIYEPTSEIIDFETIVQEKHCHILVLVPGLAFTKKGKRLGRGKGYYDRFIKKLFLLKETYPTCIITVIGLCFAFQVIGAIPTEKHDKDMDYILTEK